MEFPNPYQKSPKNLSQDSNSNNNSDSDLIFPLISTLTNVPSSIETRISVLKEISDKIRNPNSIRFILGNMEKLLNLLENYLFSKVKEPELVQLTSKALANIGKAIGNDMLIFKYFRWLWKLFSRPELEKRKKNNFYQLLILKFVLEDSPISPKTMDTIIPNIPEIFNSLQASESIYQALIIIGLLEKQFPQQFSQNFSQFFSNIYLWFIDPSISEETFKKIQNYLSDLRTKQKTPQVILLLSNWLPFLLNSIDEIIQEKLSQHPRKFDFIKLIRILDLFSIICSTLPKEKLKEQNLTLIQYISYYPQFLKYVKDKEWISDSFKPILVLSDILKEDFGTLFNPLLPFFTSNLEITQKTELLKSTLKTLLAIFKLCLKNIQSKDYLKILNMIELYKNHVSKTIQFYTFQISLLGINDERYNNEIFLKIFAEFDPVNIKKKNGIRKFSLKSYENGLALLFCTKPEILRKYQSFFPFIHPKAPFIHSYHTLLYLSLKIFLRETPFDPSLFHIGFDTHFSNIHSILLDHLSTLSSKGLIQKQPIAENEFFQILLQNFESTTLDQQGKILNLLKSSQLNLFPYCFRRYPDFDHNPDILLSFFHPLKKRTAITILNHIPSELKDSPYSSLSEEFVTTSKIDYSKLFFETFLKQENNFSFNHYKDNLLNDNNNNQNNRKKFIIESNLFLSELRSIYLSHSESLLFTNQDENENELFKDNENNQTEEKKYIRLVILLLWLSFRAARYCVSQKLKTFFGLPGNTFQQIEKVVLNSLTSAHGENWSCVKSVLLLEFIEHLEKEIYRYSSSKSSSNIKAIRIFFNGNHHVVEDLYNRLRQPLIWLATISGRPVYSSVQASQRILDLRRMISTQNMREYSPGRILSDLESSMLAVASTFANYGQTDSMNGLIIWSQNYLMQTLSKSAQFSENPRLSHLFLWLKGLYFKSRGQLERAVDSLQDILLGSTQWNLLEPATIEFIVSEVLNCYEALGNYDSVVSFKEKILPLLEQHRIYQPIDQFNYLTALQQFQKSNWKQAAIQLGVWQTPLEKKNSDYPALPQSTVTSPKSFLFPNKETPICQLREIQKYTLSALLLPNKKNFFIEKAQNLIESLWQSLSLQSNYDPSSLEPLLIQMKCLCIISEKDLNSIPFRVFNEPTFFDHPIYLRQLSAIIKFYEDSVNYPDQFIKLSNQVKSKIFSQALKTKNLRTAVNSKSNLNNLESAKILFLSDQKDKAIQTLKSLEKTPKILSKLSQWVPNNQKSEYFKNWCTLEEKNDKHKIGKPFFKYATWLFEQGQSNIEKITIEEEKKSDLEKILKESKIDCDFNQLILKLVAPVDQDSKIESIKQMLKLDSNVQTLEQILKFGQILEKEASFSLKESIIFYFKFLTYSPEDMKHQQTISCARLLKLISLYHPYFLDEIETGLKSQSSFNSWKNLIPQLFSHLVPNNLILSKLISEILKKITKENPDQVIFPAMFTKRVYPQISQTAFEILENIKEIDFLLYNETDLFIQEMLKITTLFSEQWLLTLHRSSLEIANRINIFKKEISKNQCENPKSEGYQKFLEKFKLETKSALNELNLIYNKTCQTNPSCLNEEEFQKEWNTKIQNVLQNLQSKDFEDPSTHWMPIKELAIEISRSMTSSKLNLKNISPTLKDAAFKRLKMPGVSKTTTISKIDHNVSVLATKTRPKKIQINGSNGVSYTYLLKGGEDLRLDERVQQLLFHINSLLKTQKDTKERKIRTRNYSIIPLSSEAGIIQWVEKAQPLFGLYKNWQIQQAEILNISGDKEKHFPSKLSELFYPRILKVLEEQGHKTTEITPQIRKNLPSEILKTVYMELASEAPKNLISKEIWKRSSDSLDLMKRTKSYSYSLAAMSMVGYVIGLGDRHLDNILLDSCSSEIIHIDYNICFDKGKKLRIPETVPFRLTQNLYNGMGLTGIEGNFRIACETVFSNLRTNKDVLLTLLESFEYHPLLEWSPFHNASILTSTIKKEEEEEVNENLLVIDEEFNDENQFTKIVTKKNAQAVNVLNTIKKRLTEPATIPSLIQQAISIDNLSQMYEGWYPWI